MDTLTATDSIQDVRCDVQVYIVAAEVPVELASLRIERQVGHSPYNHRGRLGQKYTYRQTDTCTPGVPGPSSGKGQGFGKASPEPVFGAGVGVVTDSDEPQDAGELFLHFLVLDRNQSLLMGTWREAERKLSLEVTFLALQVII